MNVVMVQLHYALARMHVGVKTTVNVFSKISLLDGICSYLTYLMQTWSSSVPGLSHHPVLITYSAIKNWMEYK